MTLKELDICIWQCLSTYIHKGFEAKVMYGFSGYVLNSLLFEDVVILSTYVLKDFVRLWKNSILDTFIPILKVKLVNSMTQNLKLIHKQPCIWAKYY